MRATGEGPEDEPPQSWWELVPGASGISKDDLDCILERHLFASPSMAEKVSAKVLASGRRCRHGWPQALLFDPLTTRTVGDCVRLTCPLLVSEIDKYERTGAISAYNARLSEEEEMQRELLRVNEAHRDLRRHLVEGRTVTLDKVRENLGKETVDTILSMGIATMRPSSTDVKCLHAQVGDELVRGANAIGKQVLADLEARGVDVTGNDRCCDHCNVHVALEDARWTMESAKNTLGQRLRRRKQNQLGKQDR